MVDQMSRGNSPSRTWLLLYFCRYPKENSVITTRLRTGIKKASTAEKQRKMSIEKCRIQQKYFHGGKRSLHLNQKGGCCFCLFLLWTFNSVLQSTIAFYSLKEKERKCFLSLSMPATMSSLPSKIKRFFKSFYSKQKNLPLARKIISPT